MDVKFRQMGRLALLTGKSCDMLNKDYVYTSNPQVTHIGTRLTPISRGLVQ